MCSGYEPTSNLPTIANVAGSMTSTLCDFSSGTYTRSGICDHLAGTSPPMVAAYTSTGGKVCGLGDGSVVGAGLGRPSVEVGAGSGVPASDAAGGVEPVGAPAAVLVGPGSGAWVNG